MRLFFRFIWPRSVRALLLWLPLIAAGVIACVGLSLALGFRSGVLAQHDAAVARDGPRGLPPRYQPVDGPLRSSSVVATGYGPLVVTVFAGETGQRLGISGISQVGEPGTVWASPAVLAQSTDDWTGELKAWLGDREVGTLPDAALAHPREMVIVEFTDTVPSDVASRFYPVRPGQISRSDPPFDTSFVVVGLLVLVLPSVALARAGAAVHLNARSRRYGLLRMLGAPPRQLAAAIAADMAIPMLAGALVGSAAYAAVMSSLGAFTLAGSSYWSSDLRLSFTMGLALPLVTVAVGLVSVARMVRRASRDPLGTLRRERRRRVSYLTYLAATGVLAGPTAVFAAAQTDAGLSVWLITGGLLLSVVGLEGLSRLVVAVSGRVLVSRTRAQIAGSRLSRSGSDALLGVSATAVAVLLIVFVVYSNFDDRPAPTGTFDVVAELPNLRWPAAIVRTVAGFDGVTRVVSVGRSPVFIDGDEASVYTMTCGDVPGSVKLDAPCAAGSIYLSRQTEAATVTVAKSYSDTDASIPGVYPVGGQVAASWISGSRAVLIVDRQPTPNHTTLLITTDGARDSLRHVMQGLRSQPEESYTTTQAALTSGVTNDTLIANPYLLVMATTASAMAAVALLYAVLLLFRQRQAEFRMLRCLGATRRLLAVDLGLLFAAPLILAFGLAIASGAALAASYNTSFGVSGIQEITQAIPVLTIVLAIGMAATALVAGLATRIPPLVTDPDATTA